MHSTQAAVAGFAEDEQVSTVAGVGDLDDPDRQLCSVATQPVCGVGTGTPGPGTAERQNGQRSSVRGQAIPDRASLDGATLPSDQADGAYSRTMRSISATPGIDTATAPRFWVGIIAAVAHTKSFAVSGVRELTSR